MKGTPGDAAHNALLNEMMMDLKVQTGMSRWMLK